MKVVICGAGITGLALARQLSVLGWEVVVLEKAPGPRRHGYMIDFFGAGYDAAEAMGVLPRLHELGYRVDEVRFVDDAGRSRARLNFQQFARSMDGRLLSILRPDLERALRESLPDQVRLLFSTGPSEIEDGATGVRVTLTSGEVLDADLLVGADGIHSAVREFVFGEERHYLRHLGFHTAAFTFTDPTIRAEVADRFQLTESVDRQVGVYGLRDGGVATFMVHRTADPTLPTDPRATITEEYGSLGWVVPDVLAQCPPPEELYYDQVAQIEMPSWRRGRTVLVGDACYAVSLLAGQGASLGIGGAFVLAEQLRRAGSIDSALDRYERLWRPVAEDKQRAAREGVRWFLPHSRAQLRIRRAVLGLSRLPGIDRLVVGATAGRHTDLITRLRQEPDVDPVGDRPR